eukprot:scaffold262405_cov18-Tisochrysis_lutea.AAC.1
MQAHPDRVMAPGTPPEVQQQAVAKFQKLQCKLCVQRKQPHRQMLQKCRLFGLPGYPRPSSVKAQPHAATSVSLVLTLLPPET